MNAIATEPGALLETRTSLQELRELAARRKRLREALQEVTPTLLWFAQQQEHGGMPANIWKNLDRLPSSRMHGLSPAFDLIHTLQLLERTLRQYDKPCAKQVVGCLEELTEVIKKEVERESIGKHQDRALLRLLSDDRTGTLTMESAARVLRCGTFPIRIAALPSYIAGHVIFSELRLIRAQFKQYGMSSTQKRAPSAAFVAQGVAAMRSFIRMVRRRAETCDAIANDLERITKLQNLVTSHKNKLNPNESAELQRALCAQERFLLTRLAANFRRAGETILGLRDTVFKPAAAAAEAASRATSPTDLATLFTTAADLATHQAHEDGYRSAKQFVETYEAQLKQIVTTLRVGGTRKLTNVLKQLRELHTGSNPSRVPSIGDAARVRTLEDLMALPRQASLLFTFQPKTRNSSAKTTDSARANTSLRKALRAQWDLHAEAFSEVRGEATNWIRTRYKVYKEAEKLKGWLTNARRPTSVIAALRRANQNYLALAEKIENKLIDETPWAPIFAERLLLGALTESADRSDPLDLLSALWICDRMGHAWPESLEERMAEALGRLQRVDGSFEAGRPPVKWVNGFVMLAPSAATISVLARFLSKHPRDRGPGPAQVAYERRLIRWEAMCVRGIDFLLSSRVGRHETNELSGWHSDRQPEDGRIDLFTTCVAARALCEMDEVLSKLINRHAFEGFQIRHPEPASPKDHFALDCCSIDREPETPILASAQRAADWLRYHTSGFAMTDYLPPEFHRPRTTLYYGPPGTGKTYASTIIADELHWPLVTINPHHFLREGNQLVGKVAAEIFERIQFASNCCVFFDEFDQLIIDRNVQKLPSPFAIVTATMLPLLADLHERAVKNNCLIAFATNYRALLDAAAIRHGRIDQQSCVVYPDYGSRYLYILFCGSRALEETQLIKTKGRTETTAKRDEVRKWKKRIHPTNIRHRTNCTSMSAVSDLIDMANDPTVIDGSPNAKLIDRQSKLWPSPALGPQHYDDMYEKLRHMSRFTRNPDKHARDGLSQEVDRFVRSLSVGSTGADGVDDNSKSGLEHLMTMDEQGRVQYFKSFGLREEEAKRWSHFIGKMDKRNDTAAEGETRERMVIL